MSHIYRLIGIIEKWEPIDQGIFFLIILIILSGAVSFVLAVIRYLVIMVRGWPQGGEDEG